MELNNNQFLKIKVLHRGWTDFEIFETQPSKRPKRWHLPVPQNTITNRHTKASKIEKLNNVLVWLQRGFLMEYGADEQ